MIAPITTTMNNTNATGCIAGLVFCFLLQMIIPINANTIRAPYTTAIFYKIPLFLMIL